MPADSARRYEVFVDDNFHYMDESERYRLGAFDSLEAAVAACKVVVDRCLAETYKPGMTHDELLSLYKMFGDDPFIVSSESREAPPFSAWTYADERAHEICSGAGPG